MAGAVADINRKVAEGDCRNTLQALQVPGAGLKMVLPECADTYQNELAERQTNRATEGNFTCCALWLSSDFEPGEFIHFSSGSTDSVWVKHCFKDRYGYYYNLEMGQGTWEEPEEFQNHLHHHLGKEEIQVHPLLPNICYHCHLGWGNVVIAMECLMFLETNLVFFSVSLSGCSQLCYCRI